MKACCQPFHSSPYACSPAPDGMCTREYRGRKDEPKGFGWRDFRDLLVRARIQVGGPIVVVWDNVRFTSPSRCGSSSTRTPPGSLCSSCPPTHRT